MDFSKMKIALPKVGLSAVKEAGTYVCTLMLNSLAFVTDREDIGSNDKLQAKDGAFLPKWADATPQLYTQFKTKDGQTITDRFQLSGYEHFDSVNPPTKEQKVAWAEAFAEEGIIVATNAKKQLSFAKVEHRGTFYVCAIAEDGLYYRVPSAVNTEKSLRRLNSMFNLIGFKTTELSMNTIDELKKAELKELPIVLEEKSFDGPRRSDSKLFKIQYGIYTKKAVEAPVEEEI